MSGRKKAEINWDRVDEMLKFQCDGVEIAADFGIHPDTLYRACESEHKMGFAAYSQQKRARGTSTARETFFKEAFGKKDPFDKTRAVRQIFWLKNYAGMTDKQEVNHTGEGPQLHFYLPDNGKAKVISPKDDDN